MVPHEELPDNLALQNMVINVQTGDFEILVLERLVGVHARELYNVHFFLHTHLVEDGGLASGVET